MSRFDVPSRLAGVNSFDIGLDNERRGLLGECQTTYVFVPEYYCSKAHADMYRTVSPIPPGAKLSFITELFLRVRKDVT